MLDKLRDDALTIVAGTPECALASFGPAGLQSSYVACQVRDGCIYLLVPLTSDHLLNVEEQGDVLITTPTWQLRGAAMLLAADEPRVGLPGDLIAHALEQGRVVLEVFPVRMQVEPGVRERYRETIDFGIGLAVG
jgi:hypothetical protein